jgi:DNA-binding transcriptional LysR family regulator
MPEPVELRELRVFLALAEDLHFGRAAERLGISQSRASQILRQLEHKLGGQLLYRTSRRVELTALGERFRTEVSGLYDDLADALERTRKLTRERRPVLRLGLFSEPAGRPVVPIVSAFESRHPDCVVEMTEMPLDDVFGPLRRGHIDLMVSWLPHGQADLVTGPILSSEPRVLAVGRNHPLAEQPSVPADDLADYPLPAIDGPPQELHDVWIPSKTPSGRAIPHHELSAPSRRDRGRLFTEVTYLVAAGKIVHTAIPNSFAHPDIVEVPITGLPPLRSALLWRRGLADQTVREFVRLARDAHR